MLKTDSFNIFSKSIPPVIIKSNKDAKFTNGIKLITKELRKTLEVEKPLSSKYFFAADREKLYVLAIFCLTNFKALNITIDKNVKTTTTVVIYTHKKILNVLTSNL